MCSRGKAYSDSAPAFAGLDASLLFSRIVSSPSLRRARRSFYASSTARKALKCRRLPVGLDTPRGLATKEERSFASNRALLRHIRTAEVPSALEAQSGKEEAVKKIPTIT